MDTGGLAHMTFNSSFNGGSLGVPGSGFASRGKGSHIKRLSVPHPSKLGQGDDAQHSGSVSTPRTSRSHLLAGLRTAPRQPSTPSTAPLQRPQRGGGDRTYGASQPSYHGAVPHTATASSFHQHNGHQSNGHQANGHQSNGHQSNGYSSQMYSLPEHVLAPPAIDQLLDMGNEPMDEHMYNELLSTNLYLAAQQQRLQQQLASVTAAAQQFQALSLGTQINSQQGMSPNFPAMGFYQQQAERGVQPVVHPVPGKPGVFSVYNPLTGQCNYVVDNSAMHEDPTSPSSYAEQYQSPLASTPTIRTELSSPQEQRRSPVYSHPSSASSTAPPSPPRQASPLQQQESSVAQKRAHRKLPSVAVKTGIDLGRIGTPRSATFPATPATGTFGPGQNRAGKHPLRQPRGPPSLEELVAKPTSKHEGSKNFATRQRRRAVHNLVRAGMERRAEPRGSASGSVHSSGGSLTPSSDVEFNFSSSPGDESGAGSTNPSVQPSSENLRAMANKAAIGSERKDGGDWPYWGRSETVKSPTAAEIVAGNGMQTNAPAPERRRMPRFVLSSAEKRKGPQ